MTLSTITDLETIDPIQVLSAVGDVFCGRAIGFGMQVANVAARFAAFRERPSEEVTATFFAAALHHIGAVRIVVPRDTSPRQAEIVRWDDPPAGAAIIAAAGFFPAATADAVRWHREAFDGTGFPDRLRWNGIPNTAMSINIVRAFVEALAAQAEYGSSTDAVFTLVEASGRLFTLTTMREFRRFLAAEADTYDAPWEPAWELEAADSRAFVVHICSEIDARAERTAGRGDRLDRLVRSIAARLGSAPADADLAAAAARFTALARIGPDGGADDAFTLSRLGLEARAAQAAMAARILRTAPSFARFAAIVGSTEEWFDGSGLPDRLEDAAIDPLARLLSVAIAADAVTAGDAPRRIRAARGTRLDPAVVDAYLATADNA